jgi:hypothetical protein
LVGLKWPKALAYPLGIFLLWMAAAWMIHAAKLWRARARTARADKAVQQRRDAA